MSQSQLKAVRAPGAGQARYITLGVLMDVQLIERGARCSAWDDIWGAIF